jgi:large subunit ribosomal protein L31
MKQEIHPTYFPEATVTCACGNTWTTGSTVEFIQTDVCSACHPFYTGEQRIVDTEGQVDRFYKRLQARQEYIEDVEQREQERTSPELPLTELELSARVINVLADAGVDTAGMALEKLAVSDQALLDIDGFGRKSLADLKRSLRRQGFQLPQDFEEQAETG